MIAVTGWGYMNTQKCVQIASVLLWNLPWHFLWPLQVLSAGSQHQIISPGVVWTGMPWLSAPHQAVPAPSGRTTPKHWMDMLTKKQNKKKKTKKHQTSQFLYFTWISVQWYIHITEYVGLSFVLLKNLMTPDSVRTFSAMYDILFLHFIKPLN